MAVSPLWPPQSFLGRLSTPTQQRLLSLGLPRDDSEGDVIFRQGDRHGFVAILIRGYVTVSSLAENGTEALLALRYAGDLLGEVAALSDSPETATYRTRARSVLSVIPTEKFRIFLSSEAEAYPALLQVMSRQITEANTYRLDISSYPSEIRVARALTYLLEAEEQVQDDPVVNLSQAEIAALIGAREVTVQKALRALSCFVTSRRGRVAIHDAQGLKRFAELSNADAPAYKGGAGR
jgi:CRP/FNR family transcriptional regulator, cyclic AMP receptor protein